jgi:hypothetical protein
VSRKWLEIDWEGLKIQGLKIDSIFFTNESPVDKKNSIWGKKSPKSDVYRLD